MVFPEWSLVLRAVTWESFPETGCVGASLVWAAWTGRKVAPLVPQAAPRRGHAGCVEAQSESRDQNLHSRLTPPAPPCTPTQDLWSSWPRITRMSYPAQSRGRFRVTASYSSRTRSPPGFVLEIQLGARDSHLLPLLLGWALTSLCAWVSRKRS